MRSNVVRRCKVYGDGPLVAVGGKKIGTEIAIFPIGTGHEGRPPASRVVACAGTLDLDDIRTEIREELGAGRPGKDAGEIENTKPRKAAGRLAAGHDVHALHGRVLNQPTR